MTGELLVVELLLLIILIPQEEMTEDHMDRFLHSTRSEIRGKGNLKKKSKEEREDRKRKEDEKKTGDEGREMKKIDFTVNGLNCVVNVKD